MVQEIDYSKKGILLEELAQMGESSERRARLFEVVSDIRGIIAGLYTSQQGVVKLEDELEGYESLDQQELEIISRGVQSGLRRGLDQHSSYDRDTVNQVFIGLYRHLIRELKDRTIDGVIDYSRRDNMDRDLAKVVRSLNIYHVLSSWVTHNSRSIEGLDQDEEQQATNQFRDLKKSARGFVHSFRRLLRRSYNIDDAYKQFSINKNLETYNDMRNVVEGTIRDCKKMVSDSNSQVELGGLGIIRTFAEVVMLNAEYYFLQMGYEMLHDEAARGTIPNQERFQSDLKRDAFDSSKIRYLNIMPNDGIVIFPSVKELAPEVRAFYQSPI